MMMIFRTGGKKLCTRLPSVSDVSNILCWIYLVSFFHLKKQGHSQTCRNFLQFFQHDLMNLTYLYDSGILYVSFYWNRLSVHSLTSSWVSFRSLSLCFTLSLPLLWDLVSLWLSFILHDKYLHTNLMPQLSTSACVNPCNILNPI